MGEGTGGNGVQGMRWGTVPGGVGGERGWDWGIGGKVWAYWANTELQEKTN